MSWHNILSMNPRELAKSLKYIEGKRRKEEGGMYEYRCPKCLIALEEKEGSFNEIISTKDFYCICCGYEDTRIAKATN